MMSLLLLALAGLVAFFGFFALEDATARVRARRQRRKGPMNETLETGAIACGIIAVGWGALRVVQWVRGGGDQLERLDRTPRELLRGPVYEPSEPYDVLEDQAPARGPVGYPEWEADR